MRQLKPMLSTQLKPQARVASGGGGDEPLDRPRATIAQDFPDALAGSSTISSAPSRPAKKTGQAPPDPPPDPEDPDEDGDEDEEDDEEGWHDEVFYEHDQGEEGM